MSRFKIGTQVLFLAGFMILGLVVVAGVSVFVNTQFASEIKAARTISAEASLIAEIKEDIEDSQFFLYRLASGEADALDGVRENLAEIEEAGQRVASTFTRSTEAGAGVVDAVNRVVTLRPEMEQIAGTDADAARARVTSEFMPALGAQADAIDAIQEDLIARRDVLNGEMDAQMAMIQTLLLVVNGTVVVGALGLAIFFGRQLGHPVRRLETSVRAIEARDYDFVVPDTGRGDEVGTIACALSDLRDRLAENDAATAAEKSVAERRLELFKDLGDGMACLAKGDISRRMDVASYRDLGGDYVALCEDYNALSTVIADLVSSMQSSVDTVARNSRSLSSMSDDLSQRAETQAATLEETAAAIEELSSSVSSAADRAGEADTQVEEGRRRAERGGEVMDRALTAMGSIAKSSERITQIIGVIDDIAFQTNLLALNAGVEAARAGESGKGFSVVASEVRSLAQRASESAREIKDLVVGSTKEVEDGERLVQETSVMLGQIVDSVETVSGLVSEIASSAKEQASGLREINTGMSELDSVTQKNAAMVNETNTASNQLSEEASRLAALLSQFSGGTIKAATPAAAPSAPKGTWDAEKPKAPAVSTKVEERPAEKAPAPAPAPRKVTSAGTDASLWEEF